MQPTSVAHRALGGVSGQVLCLPKSSVGSVRPKMAGSICISKLAQLCSAMLSWSGPSMPLWVNSLSGARCLWISRYCLVGSQEWDSGMGCKFSGPKFAFVPVFPRPRTKKEPWRMTVKRAVPIFSAFTSAQGQQPMWTVTATPSTLHSNFFNTWMFKGIK